MTQEEFEELVCELSELAYCVACSGEKGDGIRTEIEAVLKRHVTIEPAGGIGSSWQYEFDHANDWRAVREMGQ